ncbi:hypothetical protein KIW84_012845 [Lathyrus oleraceus]|uniref:Uncharacterized protein n=1 Tax=Pisum sativum TaxID=3888 RepID=A0A9D5BIS6_PEA|nr:hypothetical protein KIW84_012845 [Pisum sativum]
MSRTNAIDETVEKQAPVRSFGTLLAKGENNTWLASWNSDHSAKNDRTQAAPLSIYKYSNSSDETCPPRRPDLSHSWRNPGARAERNKEDNEIPAKWKSYKVPRRPGARTAVASASAPASQCLLFKNVKVHQVRKQNESTHGSQVRMQAKDVVVEGFPSVGVYDPGVASPVSSQ